MVGYVHEQAPASKVIAWVSLGAAYPARGTNLADESVRRNSVAEACWLTEKCGFDGVQWDYEPCKPGDQGFLALLRETRSALGAGKIISVATPVCRQAGEAGTWYAWDEDYFARVCAGVDQVAVMCYDFVLLFPWQYESAVKKQVPLLSKVVARAGHPCKLIFGLPTYKRNFIHNHCETLPLAIRAVREGSGLPGMDARGLAGVALFADYTTDEEAWGEYRRWWLDGDGSSSKP